MNPENYDKAYLTISKEQLASLPLATYPTDIVVIDALEKVESAVNELRCAPFIGFDTETRPSFKKGHTHKVALIQLSAGQRCYLFRTNIIGLPQPLINLLEDPSHLKVGLSIHDDFHSLARLNPINPDGFVDLQNFVKKFKIADNSLARIYGILFGEKISKGQRLSNWEASPLTDSQQGYAALDAIACTRIYDLLVNGNFNPADSPYLTYPKETPDSEETPYSDDVISEKPECPDPGNSSDS